ncbi:hypothetical protein [uncultured Dialister sp.]|uniref:hypothetical protein n=1 Tax=uncultured Dialister sp. TaxID=278064 RepID=UPI0026DC99E9|nr:hypothetical protein [uncultured Dialister sp.]
MDSHETGWFHELRPKKGGGKKRAGERDLRFLLSYFSVFLFPVIRFSVGICGSREYGIGWPMQNGTIPFPAGPAKEALIKSLSDFILGFLCNARNNSTQIASYLRQQSCIGLLSQDKLALSLHIKAPSFYSWPIYDEAVHKNPYEI